MRLSRRSRQEADSEIVRPTFRDDLSTHSVRDNTLLATSPLHSPKGNF